MATAHRKACAASITADDAAHVHFLAIDLLPAADYAAKAPESQMENLQLDSSDLC